MRFSQSTRSLRSGKTYEQAIHTKIKVNVENLNNAARTADIEEVFIENVRATFEVFEEKVRANLEPLNEKNSKNY